MKYFEKAIENYAKARKKIYARSLKNDIALFNRAIEMMTADGECHGIDCKYCPIRLASDAGARYGGCGVTTTKEKMEVIAMEDVEK